jgi:hypothetical protein
VNGYLSNFSIQGNKLKGDWTMLQNHTETPVMLERCEKQPSTFGLSVAFKGKGIAFGGKKCARAEKLLSADCVKRQAANPDGLFSAKETTTVDNPTKNMSDNIQQNNEPTLSDVMNALNQISQRQDAFEQVQSQLVDHVNESIEGQENEGGDLELLEALYNASDEELAAFNAQNGTDFTREQINADVESYNASVGGDDQGDYGDQGAEQGAEQGSVATALSAIASEVIALKNNEKFKQLSAKAQNDEIEFAQLQENIGTLVEQRDRLVELSERVIAENEALRMAGIRGGRPAGAGAEVEFKERSQGGSIIEFEAVVNEEYKKNLAKGMKDLTARSKAIDFGVKRHPVAYKLFRERGAKEINFSAQ